LYATNTTRRTTLWGAYPDGKFSILHDAPQALARTKSFHFAPGTEYSYSNVNFHVLGRILENVAGMSLSQILASRVFIPAGMSNASLSANTNGLPLPIVGYEGNEVHGYFPALNRIEWAGDAGITASLEDMIAYEKYLDASLQDSSSLYTTTSKQQHFRDGTPAAYGYGLARAQTAEQTKICHGGGLRGFRHERLQIPAERLSVLLFMNYETGPGYITDYIIKQILSYKESETETLTVAPDWTGDYLDPETQLYLQVKLGPAEKPGTVAVNYGPGTSGELVKLTSDTEAGNPGMKLRLEGDILHVERIHDNRKLQAERLSPHPKDGAPTAAQIGKDDVVGRYHSEESESTFTVSGENSTLHGSFEGFIGHGPVYIMRHLGKDVWALGNPRAMDSTPPGDWTIVFKRDGGGKVEGVTVGCWLARNVKYARL
jgi:hypothetical protein